MNEDEKELTNDDKNEGGKKVPSCLGKSEGVVASWWWWGWWLLLLTVLTVVAVAAEMVGAKAPPGRPAKVGTTAIETFVRVSLLLLLLLAAVAVLLLLLLVAVVYVQSLLSTDKWCV
jgi:hypothetical protein